MYVIHGAIQLLLSTLSTGNGILRINDILGWNEVSMKAGSSKTILSFQEAIFLFSGTFPQIMLCLV